MKETIFNEIKVCDIFYDHIIEDFDVVLVELKQEKGWRALSLLKRTIDAGVVRIGYSGQYMLLLDKNQNHLENLRRIEGIEVYPQSVKMLQRKPAKIILNLLLRAIPRINNYYWENTPIGLEYGLYYVSSVGHNERYIKTLRFDILEEEKKLYLDMSQQIFVKKNYIYGEKWKGKQPFILKNGHIQTTPEGNENSYYMGAFKTKWDKDIPYFDWTNLNKSKIGLLARLMNDIDIHLGRYLNITLKKETSAYVLRNKKSEIKTAMQTFQNLITTNIKWNIVDISSTNSCATSVHKEIKFLTKTDPLLSSKPREGYFNIVIHEDEAYYAKNKKTDPYLLVHSDNPNCVLSSITTETVKNSLKDGIKVIIKDMYIKQDLLFGRISMKPWTAKDIIFGLRTIDDKKYVDHLLFIETDGTFKYINSVLDMEDYNTVISESPSLIKLLSSLVRSEMFFCEKKVDKSAIIKTTLKQPLLDSQKIKKMADEYSKTMESTPTKEIIQEFGRDFINFSVFTPKEKSVFKNKIQEWVENKELTSLDRIGKGKVFDKFYSYLYTKHGLRLTTDGLKSEKGLMSNHFGIFVNKADKEYYVGTVNPPKSTIQRNHIVRRIVGDYDFIPDWYFELLEVGFIRNNDLTVFPYPYKYLREAILRWSIMDDNFDYSQKNIRNLLSPMYSA